MKMNKEAGHAPPHSTTNISQTGISINNQSDLRKYSLLNLNVMPVFNYSTPSSRYLEN